MASYQWFIDVNIGDTLEPKTTMVSPSCQPKFNQRISAGLAVQQAPRILLSLSLSAGIYIYASGGTQVLTLARQALSPAPEVV